MNKKGTEKKMLTTREALTFLEETGTAVKDATFYRRLKSIPHQAVPHGKVRRYLFDRDDLVHIHFRGKRKAQELVKVSSVEDLERLQQMYGPLLTTEGVIDELFKLTGHRYTRGAIVQRRLHNTIVVVGYSGEGRKEYWYPANQLRFLDLRPPANKETAQE